MNAKLNLPVGQDIIDNIANAVIVTDTNGEILLLNTAAINIQHLHKPPLKIGQMVVDSVGRQWKDIVKNVVQSVCETGIASSFESEYAIAGKRIFFDVRCSPILDLHQKASWLMFEFKDITLQKIYERKTRSISYDLTCLIETVNAVVIGIDVKGIITAWNNCASLLTGYHESDTLTKHFTEVFEIGESQDILFAIISETLLGNVVSNRELPVTAKNLQRLNLLINTTAKKNADMEIVGVMMIGLDITELTEYRHTLERRVRDRTEDLKRALDKEKELIEVKERFVSIASHEFRSPVSVIKLQTEALKKVIGSNLHADIIAGLNRIYDQADHMSVLLEDVLLIGKGDAGKICANIENVELKHLLEDIILDAENATNKSHRIIFKFPGDSLYMDCDKSIMRNIFINLLTNAIKFSPQRDQIYFEVVRQDRLIEFTVLDNGIGISECEIARIFQPFNRGTNARDIKGTGLGLSIVKKAVETLNGRVCVESKLNEGTKFTVQFDI
jgi:PAS domain S-box-containing protein